MPRIPCTVRARAMGCLLLAAASAAVPTFGARPSTPPGPLSLGAPERPVKTEQAVYIVQLAEAGAASYKGGTAGFAATKPGPGAKLDRTAAAVESYATHLEGSHDRVLADLGAGSRKIYSFRYAFNGFAVRLSAGEVSKLAQHPQVERIWRDSERQVQTDSSAVFLGLLDQDAGLRAEHGLRGEDIVIGVVDSGITPNHPALLDHEEQIPRLCRSQWARSSWLGRLLCLSVRRNPPIERQYDPAEGFRGICQQGDGFTAADCNNKLVGARYYIDGFLFRNALDPGEFVSPKDADGHGTHIATVLAGNPVTSHLFGRRIGQISGIAPRARIAMYKACWLKPGESRASCATSDLARAIDDAVADGVDIINYSVGSLESELTAPDDFALLNALDAGVLSVVAAGNDGPANATIGSPSSAPWVLTVAASTRTGTRYEESIEITAPADLGGLLQMREASFTAPLAQAGTIEETLVLVDDGEDRLGAGGLGSIHDGCEALADPAAFAGRVALVERGGCEFQVKLERVERAGAAAAVVYNNHGAPIIMNGEAGSIGIPAVMIGAADGQALVDELSAGNAVSVRLEQGLFLERRETGNRMSDFSSRGPALSEPDFLKPDITAPGVEILAGHSPDVANGRRGEQYQYLSGTSQSTPEVAGIAALLKEAHPEWSPGALKSALMTTAYQDVTKFGGESAADPFDMGSGHVDANRALDPGLVYDADFLDHAAYLCGFVEPPFPASDCNILAQAGYPFAARDLNLPSFGVTELISGDVVTRRVTNVGPPARYEASVNAPPGLEVSVEPASLTLGTGESADFSLSFANAGAERDFWSFGRLEWSDGTRTVRSPIAVQPVTLRAPIELFLEGESGTTVLPVDFGYSGEYFPGVHGLNAPFLHIGDGFVEDDPTNSFSFRSGNGVAVHDINVDPGDVFLRVSLFNELTDGEDDLDLYLYYCATPNDCTQIEQSGGFSSDEEINLLFPPPGFYRILVHGFETDAAGGPGARYELFGWAFGPEGGAGNLQVAFTPTVGDGDRWDFDLGWGPLAPGTRYLGAVSHQTPFDPSAGFYGLTLVNVIVP